MVGNVLRTLFALGAVAAALVVVGCGSSDDGDTSQASDSGGTPLSVAEYNRRAETICRKTGEAQAKQTRQIIAENPTSSSDQAELAKLTLEASKPLFTGMIEELEELEPPAGNKGDQYREWVESVEVAVDKLEANPTVAVEATVESHHKAKALGLETCSLL